MPGVPIDSGAVEIQVGRERGPGMADTTQAAKAGIGFGSALAITISWSLNKSVLWACIHGVLSWFYVIYYLAKYANP